MSAVIKMPSAANDKDAMDDRQLVNRIRAGELNLFESLMRRLNRRMFLIARSILLSDSDAEDAVQEAYVRGWQHLEEFRGPDGIGAWFARIVTNEALMRLRARNGTNALNISVVADEWLADDAPTPEQEAETMQLRKVLEEAIDSLPQPFRTTYVLREVEQLSVAETAACLGVDPATIKTRVHRARKLLRRSLEQTLSLVVVETFPFAGSRCDRIVARVMQRLSGAPP